MKAMLRWFIGALGIYATLYQATDTLIRPPDALGATVLALSTIAIWTPLERWLSRPEPAQLIAAAPTMTTAEVAEFKARWEKAHAPCTCDQCDVMGCRHGECQDCPRHTTRRRTR